MASSSAISSGSSTSLGRQDADVYCIVKFGQTLTYTIPSFSVITVNFSLGTRLSQFETCRDTTQGKWTVEAHRRVFP